MIEIKPYAPDLEQKHIDFASKYWTKLRRKTPEYIYWKFRGKHGRTLPSFILDVINDELNESMINKKFYYTYSDCDENI